ncbi:MAG: hypothetical protein RR052_03260, partial [Oscillospiraceae bacterium]
ITAQVDGCSNETLADLQVDLNDSYNQFVKKYGNLTDKNNIKFFKEDNSYSLIYSLEQLDEDKKVKGLADIFTKRTIN